ncbi:MAG: 2-amino-4-hydroxy-6-hydroxymethyldihydropteridine diphosphokinase [Akkermansiaceae bacterium]|nr:2-amino-4-hydroxy-6-hydroxymethyldihydropteridine diphosphokinase [Akkermansiaceae bacterium]
MAKRVGLALGSNVGDRLANLRKARDMLRALAPVDVHFEQAPVYQSEPVGCPPGSPDFFNTVVELDYVGKPHELLASAQGIEFHLGRESVRERNAPRVIDIDLLYFDDLVMEGDILTLPHPRLTHRLFVLQPLADIRPHLVLPGDRATIAEHLRRIDSGERALTLVQATW